ncbi:MAG: LysM peptidoglycan-binding domain-containing protein [Gaiellaceae bacterium]
MAIPVGRPRFEAREDRLPLYGARAAAFAGYAAALVTGMALVGPALTDGDAPAVTPSPSDPRRVQASSGDTPASLAAAGGVSLARLFALNPDLGPVGPEPGQTVRVR